MGLAPSTLQGGVSTNSIGAALNYGSPTMGQLLGSIQEPYGIPPSQSAGINYVYTGSGNGLNSYSEYGTPIAPSLYGSSPTTAINIANASVTNPSSGTSPLNFLQAFLGGNTPVQTPSQVQIPTGMGTPNVPNAQAIGGAPGMGNMQATGNPVGGIAPPVGGAYGANPFAAMALPSLGQGAPPMPQQPGQGIAPSPLSPTGGQQPMGPGPAPYMGNMPPMQARNPMQGGGPQVAQMGPIPQGPQGTPGNPWRLPRGPFTATATDATNATRPQQNIPRVPLQGGPLTTVGPSGNTTPGMVSPPPPNMPSDALAMTSPEQGQVDMSQSNMGDADQQVIDQIESKLTPEQRTALEKHMNESLFGLNATVDDLTGQIKDLHKQQSNVIDDLKKPRSWRDDADQDEYARRLANKDGNAALADYKATFPEPSQTLTIKQPANPYTMGERFMMMGRDPGQMSIVRDRHANDNETKTIMNPAYESWAVGAREAYSKAAETTYNDHKPKSHQDNMTLLSALGQQQRGLESDLGRATRDRDNSRKEIAMNFWKAQNFVFNQKKFNNTVRHQGVIETQGQQNANAHSVAAGAQAQNADRLGQGAQGEMDLTQSKIDMNKAVAGSYDKTYKPSQGPVYKPYQPQVNPQRQPQVQPQPIPGAAYGNPHPVIDGQTGAPMMPSRNPGMHRISRTRDGDVIREDYAQNSTASNGPPQNIKDLYTMLRKDHSPEQAARMSGLDHYAR